MPQKASATPLMRQYHAIKARVSGALLLFHLGDFYELFYEDAAVAARDLRITLTSRNKEKGEPVPMCGFPVRSADAYIAKLIEKGRRVAVCEQVEDAKNAKKLVRREVTRIISPGAASDPNLLKEDRNNYLAAVFERRGRVGLAYADISTGEFRMTEVEPDEIDAALENLGARETLVPAAGPLFSSRDEREAENGARPVLRTELEPWVFDFDYCERLLRDHFGLHALDGLGAAGSAAAVCAAGALLHHLKDIQRGALGHLDRPAFYRRRDWMALDPVTVRNLELVEPLFGGPPKATLLNVINRTATPMGARLLRQWLLRPSLDRREIESRLGGVAELKAATIERTEIRRELGDFLDIERLSARVTLGSAAPRDVLGLGVSLRGLPILRSLVSRLKSDRMRGLLDRLDDLADVRDRILSTLDENPPPTLADGGVIARGVDAELDELREIRSGSREHIARMEVRERERTGIQSLKIRHNSVFGFYIEISKANARLAPEDYQRKQTLVNAERFITPELKSYETKVHDAEERILVKERALFDELRAAVAREASRVRATALTVAELDLLQGLALLAAESGYERPEVAEEGEIRIAGGRHPVIERLAEEDGAERFIPNDVYLDDDGHRIAVITGPNMGGKSTYLRQTALIAILAQIGSFVPARQATLPIIDRVFTRIGASDNLALGRSTFMVEMTETAQILNTATPRSLVLLDEVGRGTSTFDGLAIAWAAIEYIDQRTRAKTLFATHYHELTELAELLPGVVNLHVSVKESGGRVVFLRKVEPGKADRSYGIEVARLAGLPEEVIERARAVLRKHELRETGVSEELSPGGLPPPLQISFFDPRGGELMHEIRDLDLDHLTPVQALSLIAKWQDSLREEAAV